MQTNATSKWLLILGSINMFLAVALGAFGAHALKAGLPPDLMAVYHTGNQYHFYHALGLFAVAVAAALFRPSRLFRLSGAFILAAHRSALDRDDHPLWRHGLHDRLAAARRWRLEGPHTVACDDAKSVSELVRGVAMSDAIT